MGCHFFLQGVFLTQGSNLRLSPVSSALQADSLPTESYIYSVDSLGNFSADLLGSRVVVVVQSPVNPKGTLNIHGED